MYVLDWEHCLRRESTPLKKNTRERTYEDVAGIPCFVHPQVAPDTHHPPRSIHKLCTIDPLLGLQSSLTRR